MNLLLEVTETPQKLNDLSIQQWEILIRYARNAKMLGTLAAWTKQYITSPSSLPDELTCLLEGEAVKSSSFQLVANWELDEIEHIFADSDFPIIVLKGGAYLRAKRPWHQGRRLSDVDLLISKQHIPEAEALLKRHGWTTDSKLSEYDEHYYRELSHELPPYKNPVRGIELDLHHNLIPPTSRIKFDANEVIERSIRLPNSRLSVLCDEDMFIHSAVHLLFNDELRGGIRDIVDMKSIAEYAIKQSDSGSDNTFWQRLEARSRELKVTRPVYYAVSTLSHFFEQHSQAITPFELHSPNILLKSIMEYSVRDTLAPDINNAFKQGLPQLLLYIRSHWVRMPPLMLMKHLAYKAWVRHKASKEIGRKSTSQEV